MTDVKVGKHLVWQAADTTGIVGTLHVAMMAWMSTDTSNRDIAQADICRITDQDGKAVIAMKCVTAGVGFGPITFDRGQMTLNGILVPNLDGGELFITVYDNVPTNRGG